MISTETVGVKGMSCASCSAIITKKLSKLEGVESADVNFATEKAELKYDPEKVNIQKMNEELEKLGYSVFSETVHEDKKALSAKEVKDEKLKDLNKLKSKIFFIIPSVIITFVMMFFNLYMELSKTHKQWGNLMQNLDWLSLILATISLVWVGKPFVLGVWKFFRYGSANMDTLVGLGTITAYIYSTLYLLFPAVSKFIKYDTGTFFDVTIIVIGFVTLGKYLESRSKLQTGEAIEKLLGLQAKSALIEVNGEEKEVQISEVKVNDIVIVKPGQKIPLDGVIISGKSSVDESTITGESIPVDKNTGDKVIGSTINKQGSFKFQVGKIGEDTVLSQIIKMVEKAQGSKAPIQKLADKVSEVFVITVLTLAVTLLILWIVVGYMTGYAQSFQFGLLSFIGVLVIACPCALGLATPTGIIVGCGKGAENGILIKDADSLQKLEKINYIVFDKTGTLTNGTPEVTDIIYDEKDKEILRVFYLLEKKSDHPLAMAIVNYAVKQNESLIEIEDFESIDGKGVKGIFESKEYFAGNLNYAKSINVNLDNEMIDKIIANGKTPVIFFTKEKVIAYLGISDTIKKDSIEVIKMLKEMGIKTAMISGDNKKTAEYIANQLGIENVIAEVLPGDKAEELQKIQKQNYKVAMVGDGVNDAPALASADIGIAMGNGTDVAIESAGITLLGGNINKLPKAIKLSRMTMKIIKENLFWAFFYNIIGIPVAAGILYPIWGVFLNPAIAGAAMAFSSVSVVLNSLRLKAIKL